MTKKIKWTELLPLVFNSKNIKTIVFFSTEPNGTLVKKASHVFFFFFLILKFVLIYIFFFIPNKDKDTLQKK